LIQRIFALLSDGIKLSRVYFKTFIEKFYFRLWHEHPREREKFIFDLLDWDGDGIIKQKDLIQTLSLIDFDSKFGQEL
jgi:Ca2+-binding EF-hand superfamily protein